jgi:hypothetical protein
LISARLFPVLSTGVADDGASVRVQFAHAPFYGVYGWMWDLRANRVLDVSLRGRCRGVFGNCVWCFRHVGVDLEALERS